MIAAIYARKSNDQTDVADEDMAQFLEGAEEEPTL
jgi:hypothetical protein